MQKSSEIQIYSKGIILLSPYSNTGEQRKYIPPQPLVIYIYIYNHWVYIYNHSTGWDGGIELRGCIFFYLFVENWDIIPQREHRKSKLAGACI